MSKTQTTVIAALFKPIKLLTFPVSDSLRLKFDKIPFIKLHSIKSPLENLGHLPALKIAKKNFYTNAKISFSSRSPLEAMDVKAVLAKQSSMMKDLIENAKADIQKETLIKYQQFK